MSFSLSPSLAQSFIQICLDGVQEVRSIDIVLVQFDTEEGRREEQVSLCVCIDKVSILKVNNSCSKIP